MQTKKRIYCNTCGLETNHNLKSDHNNDHYEIENEGTSMEHLVFYEKTKYGFYICLGCDTAIIEEQYHCSGMYDPSNDGNVYSTSHHPKRATKKNRKAKRFIFIDNKLREIYKEIIQSYNQDLRIICSIGIRALLEGICIQEKIKDTDAYGLKKKINLLKNKNNIPTSIIDALMHLKLIGDNAAHSLNKADRKNISSSIDILEALLTNLYEAKFNLEHKAKQINDLNKVA